MAPASRWGPSFSLEGFQFSSGSNIRGILLEMALDLEDLVLFSLSSSVIGFTSSLVTSVLLVSTLAFLSDFGSHDSLLSEPSQSNIVTIVSWPISFKLVGETGFEPATYCSQSNCATRLRHSQWWWGKDSNLPPQRLW